MTNAPIIEIPEHPGYRHVPDARNLPMKPLLFSAPPLTAIPEAVEWPFNYPHLNQGNTGTCTQHGVLHHCMGEPMPTPRSLLPPGFALYDYAVSHDGFKDNDLTVDPGRTFGTDDNSIMEAARAYGLFNGWVFAKSMDDVLRWIAANGGVCFGTPWSPAFNTVDDEGFITASQAVNLNSGHFYYIGAYDQSGKVHSRKFFLAHNSWSDAWGDRGRFRIDIDYAEWLIFHKGGDVVAAIQTGPLPPPDPTPPVPPPPEPVPQTDEVFQYPFGEALTVDAARARGLFEPANIGSNRHIVYVIAHRIDRAGMRLDAHDPTTGAEGQWPIDHFAAAGHLADGTLDDPSRVFTVWRAEAHHRPDWNV